MCARWRQRICGLHSSPDTHHRSALVGIVKSRQGDRARHGKRGNSVLVVDPNHEELLVVREWLEGAGYSVFCVKSMAEATKAVRKRRFKFSVIELKLPDGLGFEVIRRLIARQPGCRIVVLSEYCTVKTAIAAVKLGAFDALPKPQQPEILIEVLLGAKPMHTTGFMPMSA